MPILVFGHKNPDTDSVASCIALAYLKNQIGVSAVPHVLGNINRESHFMLNFFGIEPPALLEKVNIQVKDIDIDPPTHVSPKASILTAFKLMENNNIKTLAIGCPEMKLKGIITMKDIAMALIRGDYYKLDTSVSNIVKDLDGELLSGNDENIQGKILVMAYNFDSLKSTLGKNSIIIVGDRYDVLTYAIVAGVKLILLTGGRKPPEEIRVFAEAQNACIISVPHDTYTTAKLLTQCNFISTIMKTLSIVSFNHNQYLTEVKEEVLNSSFRNYPVLNDDNQLMGFIHRRHVLNPGKKKVILVDHNEYAQSAIGLNEAEIVEIVDHHKLGDITTSMPIAFRNNPVGSTCTIVYNMFKEQRVEVPHKIAGAIISGIISDTLLLKSPTTSEQDRVAIKELNQILNIDIEEYSKNMFKSGTSLEGHSIEEIFNKDLKEFFVDKHKIGISQVFTLDIEGVFNKKRQYINYINKIHCDKGYFLTLMLVTDIIKEGSYLLFKSNNKSIIPMTFNVEAVQGIFVEKIISRKKQILPKIMEVLNYIR